MLKIAIEQRRMSIAVVVTFWIVSIGGCAAVHNIKEQIGLEPTPGQQQMQRQLAEQKREAEKQAKEQREAEVRRQQMEKQRAAKQKRVVDLERHPTKRLVAFEKLMTPIWKDKALALVVAMCELRSDYWFNSLITGLYLSEQYQIKKAGLSDDELDATAPFRETIRGSVDREYPHRQGGLATLRSTCTALVNSQDIADLDRLQLRLTGNYH